MPFLYFFLTKEFPSPRARRRDPFSLIRKYYLALIKAIIALGVSDEPFKSMEEA